MDASLLELFAGPKSTEDQAVLTWLHRIRMYAAHSPLPSIRRLERPLNKAVEAANALTAKGLSPEAAQSHQNSFQTAILESRVLWMYSVLEQLNKVRNDLAALAARAPQGSVEKTRLLGDQKQLETLLDGLGLAYEELRQGRTERLPEALGLLQQVASFKYPVPE